MSSNKSSRRAARTLYCAEGGIHLYSSEPTVLTPAQLYQVKDQPELRRLVQDCNIYLIAARHRILIDPGTISVEGAHVHGRFLVQRPDGVVPVPFAWPLPAEPDTALVDGVGVALGGTHLDLVPGLGGGLVPAHVVAARADSTLRSTDTDLEILYVGQGIGRSSRRSALDRLLGHTTLQRILAEMTTYYPQSEVLLLLYRFEHQKTLISTGGDLTADPLASQEEELAHLRRMSSASLTRHERVALVEAALIRYFQPWFNVQIKGHDFSGQKKIKVLERLLKKDLTGLMVEICTASFGARLRTAHATPLDLTELFPPEVLAGSRLEYGDDKIEWQRQLHAMAHTHYANFPLTTPAERDTFMHGVRWHGVEERQPFMGGRGG